jgi:hypothetical protein
MYIDDDPSSKFLVITHALNFTPQQFWVHDRAQPYMINNIVETTPSHAKA